MSGKVKSTRVWTELLGALSRQDPLGYLRACCHTPTEPITLVETLAMERRAIQDALAASGPDPELAEDVEAFYAVVTAEAFRWLRDGRVWPWPHDLPAEAPPQRQLGVLRDSIHRILGELDLKRLLPLVVERAAALTAAEAAFLLLADPATAGLTLIESRGLAGVGSLGLHVDALQLATLLDGEPAAYVTAATATWLAPLATRGVPVLIAPLWRQHELVGLIGCIGTGRNAAAPDVLAMLADLTAIGIRNAAYYREIHQKAADLHAANERLMDLDRLKDDFLATVSHELRTPLNFITGFGSIMMEGEDVPPLEGEQRYFMGKVLTAASQLLEMVNDLLDCSRIQAGKLSLSLAPLDPALMLQGAAEDVRPIACQRGLELVLEPLPVLPWVVGDRHRLAQVLRNLLSNAIKFTPAGGRIVMRAELRGGRVRVDVRDTGIGIPPEGQSKLFERFVQLQPPRASDLGGTGLGLAISRSLVEAHGGRIGVDSPLTELPFGHGAGSSFWFELPAEPFPMAPGTGR